MSKTVSMAGAMIFAVIFVLAVSATAKSTDLGPSEPLRFSGTTMGPIIYNVVIAHPPAGLDQETASQAIGDALSSIDRLMSTYKPDSDVSRFNRSESTDWFDVDPETARVVARAMEISELSEGAFDITVAPVVNRWKFGPDKSTAEFTLPDPSEIDELKKRVGYRWLEVRTNPPAIKKTHASVTIDLSAIAKGYAVDCVANALAGLQCTDYMVEVGGEILAKGNRQDGGPWRIGVERPDELSMQQVAEIIELKDCALATSGDYRQYRSIQGKRYSHTIDPRTCVPVENRIASVTILASDCMTADGVATAVLVLGAEQGMQLCERMGLEVLIKVRNEEFGDKLKIVQSKNFPVSKVVSSDSDDPNTDDAASSSDSNAIWRVFVAAMVLFALAVLGMASGAIFGRKSMSGSCGGLGSGTGLDGNASCDLCSQPSHQCPEK